MSPPPTHSHAIRGWTITPTTAVASADDGVTFGRERRLGRTGDLTYAATAGGQRFLGDYIGVTASVATAHAVWCLSARPRLGAPGALHQVALSATFTR